MKFKDIKGHGDMEEIYAIVSIDENNKAGLCAASTPLGMTPCIGMTLKDMKKWRPYLGMLKQHTAKGTKIKIIKYKLAEVVTEL